MPVTKTIVLTKPIDLHGKREVEIKLREPSGADYIRIGEPRVLVYSATGSGYWVEQPDAIAAYCERCIEHDLGGDLIKILTLEDAMAVKEGVLSFFSDAAEKRAAKKSTASSSASA